MKPGRKDWVFRCSGCGFLASTLAPGIGQDAALDETHRERALENLRRRNFEAVLDRIERFRGAGRGRVLDVGCAHGWFQDAAARRGYQAIGVEPDAEIGNVALRKGHEVHLGYFPAALPKGETFDVITFHDVFEHLPDVEAVLVDCRSRLRSGGLLVLNLPSRLGIFFRIATLLDGFGISGPYERMWQKRFPSPHLSYFDPAALARLVARHGFRELERGALPSIDREGLWKRLRFDRESSVVASVVMWLGIGLAAPVIRWLPPDITVQVFGLGG